MNVCKLNNLPYFSSRANQRGYRQIRAIRRGAKRLGEQP